MCHVIFAGSVGRQGDEKLTARMGENVFQVYFAFTLGRAPPPECDKLRQPGICVAVGGEGKQRRRVLQVQSCADDKPYAGFLGGTMGTYDTGKCVAVRNGDCGKIERGGRLRLALDARLGPERVVHGGEQGAEVTRGGGGLDEVAGSAVLVAGADRLLAVAAAVVVIACVVVVVVRVVRCVVV